MYRAGDYVKVEVVNEVTRELEWLWLEISGDDPAQRLVFGRIDNEPVANPDICREMELAVSYDNIRDHRSAASFKP